MSSVFSQVRSSISDTLAAKQTLFFHAGLFLIALLIGIARYSRSIPPQLIAVMTLWSVGLMLHGVLIYRVTRSSEAAYPGRRDGLLNSILLSLAANGLMWVMWTLATDAQDSTPWHLGVWLGLLTIGVVALIIGKRALHNYWLNEFIRESGETKPKREQLPQLNDDGELVDVWLDEQGDNYVSPNARRENA